MNTNDNFYMVLLSDSSMDYFPENTATRFKTYLPHDVRLTGSWVVGLTEMQYPCSLLHIQNRDDGYVAFIKGDETSEVMHSSPAYAVPRGLYENLDHLIKALNHLPEVGNHILFECKKHDHGYVKMYRICEDKPSCKDLVHLLNLSWKLKNILGIDQDSTGQNGFAFEENEKIVADQPASLERAFPDRMLIYCDLCGPYVTGDVQTSLLRIAPFDGTNYKYGSTRTTTFSSPNYIPLLQNGFRTIEIDIRDGQGRPIPFQYGPLNLTLHFKRVDT